ncbi:hypothetical protein HK100_002201 [Physocladia obscura]|uniref:Ankyrin repeat protein n=1 Tax=Physocladia obscura TaxID=109957 RepID=A0AAD5XH81_9FUNG|nr:hypothetical protein HK100_002201 [Physocladia obscura]
MIDLTERTVALFQAAQAGDKKQVSLQLESVTPEEALLLVDHARGDDNLTLIHVTASANDVGVLAELASRLQSQSLQRLARIPTAKMRNTALHLAAQSRAIDVARFLLSPLGKSERSTSDNATGTSGDNSPLAFAAAESTDKDTNIESDDQAEVIASLLGATNAWGETPLHCAAAVGDTKLVELLVASASASLLLVGDAWGRTARQVAIEHGYLAAAACFPIPPVSTTDTDGKATNETTNTKPSPAAIPPPPPPPVPAFARQLMDVAAKRVPISPESVKVKHLFAPVPHQEIKLSSNELSVSTSTLILSPISNSSPTPIPRKKSISSHIEYPGDIFALKSMLSDPVSYDPLGNDLFGWSALHKFASWNKPDLLQILVDSLADPNVCSAAVNAKSRNADAFTPAHCAIDNNALTALSTIVCNFGHLVDLHNVLDAKGRSVAHFASERQLDINFLKVSGK